MLSNASGEAGQLVVAADLDPLVVLPGRQRHGTLGKLVDGAHQRPGRQRREEERQDEEERDQPGGVQQHLTRGAVRHLVRALVDVAGRFL